MLTHDFARNRSPQFSRGVGFVFVQCMPPMGPTAVVMPAIVYVPESNNTDQPTVANHQHRYR